jgi:hypothetical protein
MQIDWPGIRAAAVAIGVREAARRAAADLSQEERNRFVERVMKRCSTEKWLSVREEPPAQPQGQAKPISAKLRNGSEAVGDAVADNSRACRIALSVATRKAGETFARMNGARVIGKSKALRDVTAAAAQVGGWEQKGEGESIDVNILSIGGAVNLTKR